MIFSTRNVYRTAAVCAVYAALSGAAIAGEPLVTLEGEMPPGLQDLMVQVLGEADNPPRSIAQARRRAQQGADQAMSLLRSQGYYGAEVIARIDEQLDTKKSEKRRAPRPVLNVRPGSRFKVASVDIVFDGFQPENLEGLRALNILKAGAPAEASKVVETELRLVNYLRANGYPEARALPRKAVVDHAAKTLTVTHNIFAGDKTLFGKIVQNGTANIVKSWPKMIAPFDEGDVFDDRKLNKLASRVIGTAVFDGANATLDEEKIANADGSVTRNILLNVEQGAINTVSGEVGYSTTDGSGLDVIYERRNFIGYAQTLRLIGIVRTNEVSAGVTYNIPFAWRVDRELDFGASVARVDTDAFTGERASGNALVTQKFAPHLKVAGGISFEASQFDEDNQRVRSYIIEGLLKANYDTRDSLFDPSKGFNVEADVTPTYNFGKAEGLFTNAELGVSTYRRVSEKFVAAGRVKAGTIFGASQASVPLNRRYYAGGGGSVRGIGFQAISPLNADGNPVGGRSVAEASAELRYRGDSPLGFVGFLDVGSVSREDLPTLADLRYGAGVGVRYYTSFAPLRADIAIPINKREGDNAVQIYISIGQAF